MPLFGQNKMVLLCQSVSFSRTSISKCLWTKPTRQSWCYRCDWPNSFQLFNSAILFRSCSRKETVNRCSSFLLHLQDTMCLQRAKPHCQAICISIDRGANFCAMLIFWEGGCEKSRCLLSSLDCTVQRRFFQAQQYIIFKKTKSWRQHCLLFINKLL